MINYYNVPDNDQIKHLLYLSTSMLHDHDNYPINIKSSRPSSVMSWVRETQAYLKSFHFFCTTIRQVSGARRL